MRAPRKMYLLISRKAKGDPKSSDVHMSFKAAKEMAAHWNKQKRGGADDWKPETYVKGD